MDQLAYPSCYGKMYPALGDKTPNVIHKGMVFGFVIKSFGLMQSGHEVVVDDAAWKACLSCPHHRDCYDLSTARFQIEMAVSV
jgi:hypothetical protein